MRARLEDLLVALQQGDQPDRARVEDILTDGYAWALKLDAECSRLERSIGTMAASLEGESQAQELSRIARRLARTKRDLSGLRGTLSALRTEAAEAKVA